MTERIWEDYIDTQLEMECRVVTAINAYHYLTGETANQGSPRYEALRELAGARYGSVISMREVFEELMIEQTEAFFTCWGWVECGAPLPIEVNIWHKSYRFHSVAIVGFEPRSEVIQVANFSRVTTSKGWVFLEDFQHFAYGRQPYRLFQIAERTVPIVEMR